MNHLDACQQDLLQTGTRKLRPLLLSVLCLVACHVVAGEEAVLAQRRVPANGQVETPSQRVLPLPEGGSIDLRQQVEWLRQLKGLLGAGGELPKLPPIDAEQPGGRAGSARTRSPFDRPQRRVVGDAAGVARLAEAAVTASGSSLGRCVT